MKALHILSDEKFIDKHIARYENSALDSRYIYLNGVNKYHGTFTEKVEFVNHNDEDEIKILSNSANKFDLIFVYFLNHSKVKFVNYLNSKKPIIIWFFFGAEVYSSPEIKSRVLSLRTKEVLRPSIISKIKVFSKDLFRIVKYGLKGRATPRSAFKKAVQRVDYLGWYSEEEYKHIQSLVRIKLPAFLHLNIKLKALISVPLKKEGVSILLGNSRDPLNNHVDIIDIFKSLNTQVRIDIPFSYGANKVYAESIRSIVSESRLAIELHEEFMSYNEYVAFVGQHSTAIYNSYRQMALGNILVALWSGLKVYLSIKNPTYLWLNNLGFRIFSIEEDLICDLKSNNLVLERESIEYNFKLYADISKEENDVAFMKKLYGLTTPS